MSDDTELLARARTLDPEALGRVHDLYYGAIFRYIAFRVGHRETAEDLTSDVFERFLQALRAKTAPQSALRAWLFGVAARVVADHHRRGYRAPQVELDETLASGEGEPDAAVEDQLTREDLRQAVSSLTEEQQHVLALRFGREMPIQDVARTLGKTEGAIKMLQARAIAALARTMTAGAGGL